MSMERLTDNTDYCKKSCGYEMPEVDCVVFECYDRKIYNKLREYEDAEEQGLLLIRLPCRPNEMVWATHKDCRTVRVQYSSIWHILTDMEAGWAIGYTKEEAEAALAEMNNI